MAPVRDDYLLRMIEQAFQVLRRVMGRRTEEELPAALQTLGDGIRELLGPAAEVIQRLDAATAVPLLADANRAAVWARLLAERASLLASAGDAAAPAAALRSLQVALEARELARGGAPLAPAAALALDEALELSTGHADAAALTPRHRALLATG